MYIPFTMKTCKQCLEEKPLGDFYQKDKKANRYSSICKKCELINQEIRVKKESSEEKELRLEKRRNKSKDSYKNNPFYRQNQLDRNKKSYFDLRKVVIEKYGGKCECCGEQNFEFLSIDHINGGGSKELSSSGLGNFLRKLQREEKSSDYRVLCRNCNQSIGYYGFCPHKKMIIEDKNETPWRKRYVSLRKKVIDLYGGKCDCCKEDIYEFLAIDHVKGNGRDERKALTPERFLSKLIKLGEPHADYRILCHNCNSSFWDSGYCPHQNCQSVNLPEPLVGEKTNHIFFHQRTLYLVPNRVKVEIGAGGSEVKTSPSIKGRGIKLSLPFIFLLW